MKGCELTAPRHTGGDMEALQSVKRHRPGSAPSACTEAGNRKPGRIAALRAGYRAAVAGVPTVAVASIRRSANCCANRYATSEPATASSIGTRLS